eukprot:CAMPEP_0194443370 /NCGR_PEP_ID=MMETSP0176-20130528/126662_1 /TAXON_ID=216777 /ORGANISM="Proboscia alata, Strain PI-D3" /LENGTH=626 /DNA_ID=CAMNT_0039269599 /DNA_START=284 /DNA_END=2161 /DNA_ORIENTATION=+
MPTQSQASGNPNMSASNGASGPGAFSVDSSSSQGTVFRVSVPQGVIPGQEFQVHAGDRIVRVRCPPDTRPGQFLQITVPRDSDETQNGPPGHHRPSDQTDDSSGEAFQVVIPQGVSGGQQFHVMFNGNQLTVTCPANASAGMKVRIMAPKPRPDIGRATDVTRGPRQQQPARPRPEATTEMFEVVVPPGINAGQPFALMAGGQRVLVTCPPNAISGQKIRFQLPIALTQPRVKKDGTTTQKPPELVYDDGWMRTIRVTDMKFQWIRMDTSGTVKLPERFDVEKSAYVRFIDFVEGRDHRMRAGILSLVPADEGAVESRIRGTDGDELVTYSEIAAAQGKSFEEKVQWFHETCAQLCVEWNEGHMRMNVRREFLLHDSMEAVMSLSRKDLRKVWRFEFIGEAQKIRFQLPIALTQPRVKKDGTTTQKPPELVYDDGWMRSIRVTDMKFQWIRMDKSGEVKLPERFDQEKSAYVRFIDFGDKDQRIRTGTLSLVPADQGVVESRVRGTDGEDLVTYAEIASAQGKSFEEKVDWFHDTCRQIRVSWNEGHMRMNVRRESMLSDSMEAVMSLSCKDLRKDWRFYFIGEEGIDAGGLSREWFQLVTQDLFNPDNGLWSLNSLNQMCMDINP